MTIVAIGRPFNFAVGGSSWDVPGAPTAYRLGVAVYDLPDDVAANAYVIAHTVDALLDEGEYILQDQPLATPIANTNRRHVQQSQVIASGVLNPAIPPNYNERGPLGRQPSFVRGILEPAPGWPGLGDIDPAVVRWNAPLQTDAGVELQLITLPTGAAWKDSAWTHSGKAFMFGDNGGANVVAAEVTSVVTLHGHIEHERRIYTVIGDETPRGYAPPIVDTPPPRARKPKPPAWKDDPTFAAGQRRQAEAIAARTDEDGEFAPLAWAPAPVYRMLPIGSLGRAWRPAPWSSWSPSLDPFITMRAWSVEAIGEQVRRWFGSVVQPAPDKSKYVRLMYLNPDQRVVATWPRQIQVLPHGWTVTPRAAPHREPAPFAEGDRTEDIARWRYGKLSAKFRRRTTFAEWRAAA